MTRSPGLQCAPSPRKALHCLLLSPRTLILRLRQVGIRNRAWAGNDGGQAVSGSMRSQRTQRRSPGQFWLWWGLRLSCLDSWLVSQEGAVHLQDLLRQTNESASLRLSSPKGEHPYRRENLRLQLRKCLQKNRFLERLCRFLEVAK